MGWMGPDGGNPVLDANHLVYLKIDQLQQPQPIQAACMGIDPHPALAWIQLSWHCVFRHWPNIPPSWMGITPLGAMPGLFNALPAV